MKTISVSVVAAWNQSVREHPARIGSRARPEVNTSTLYITSMVSPAHFLPTNFLTAATQLRASSCDIW